VRPVTAAISSDQQQRITAARLTAVRGRGRVPWPGRASSSRRAAASRALVRAPGQLFGQRLVARLAQQQLCALFDFWRRMRVKSSTALRVAGSFCGILLIASSIAACRTIEPQEHRVTER
jgi:hypothetical protein